MPTSKDRTSYFADYYKAHRKPRPQEWRPCACNCGKLLKGRAGQLYLNGTHRQRAHRARGV